MSFRSKKISSIIDWWGGGESGPPVPLSNVAVLAEFVKHNDTVEDISGTDSSRNPRNLFAVQTNLNAVKLPRGTGAQDIAFGNGKPFTIAFWVKSSMTAVGQEFEILNNLNWGVTYRGIQLYHTSDGTLKARLHRSQNNYWIATNNGANSFMDIAGNTISNDGRFTINGSKYTFCAVTYDGTFSTTALRVFANKGIAPTSSAVTTGTGADDFASPTDWRLGAHSAHGNTAGYTVRFSEFMVYNVAKTHQEIINLQDGYLDTTGLLRYYKFEEETGAVIYNHYVTDYSNPANGSITATASTARVSAGFGTVYGSLRSFANKYGYKLSGTDIIPINLADLTKAVDDTTPTYTGKVKYPVTINTLSPLSFKPNPNGYDELNYLGLTSSIDITESESTYFYNSEIKNPLFRNKTGTKFLLFNRKLRHFAEGVLGTTFNLGTDEIGSVLDHLGIKTTVVAMIGQSNASGTNRTNEGDYVNTDYKLFVQGAYISNNGDFPSAQTVSLILAYNPALSGGNDKGNLYGPDSSMLRDLRDANKTVYMHKYGIGASSLPYIENFYYWHPTQPLLTGTGVRLYPLFISGIQQTIALLESKGRSNIEVIVAWDQGETNIGSSTYQSEMEELDTALKADIPEYQGKIVLRRLHSAYAGSNIIRTQQTGFAAADPANRKWFDSDAFASWDSLSVHLTIPGQEDSGQAYASEIITAGWID